MIGVLLCSSFRVAVFEKHTERRIVKGFWLRPAVNDSLSHQVNETILVIATKTSLVDVLDVSWLT